MGSEEFLELYWESQFGIVAPQFRMSLEQLLSRVSELEAFRTSSSFEKTARDELVEQLSQIIELRQRSWPNKYLEIKALVVLASEGRLAKPSISFSMGAGKAVFWDYERLFEQAEISRFHYDIAVSECTSLLELEAESEKRCAPPEALIFASRVLSGRLKRPKNRGPQKLHSYSRDKEIVELVQLATENGLKTYRNEATNERLSACDLVAEVCANSDCGVSTYEAVRKIYANKSRREAEFLENLYPCSEDE